MKTKKVSERIIEEYNFLGSTTMNVFGSVGTGKTYFMKECISTVLKNRNASVYVISGECNEYDDIVKKYNGVTNNLSMNDNLMEHINPLEVFPIMYDGMSLKAYFIASLCEYIMGKELSLPKRSILYKAIGELYGVDNVHDWCIENTTNIPIMDDLIKILSKYEDLSEISNKLQDIVIQCPTLNQQTKILSSDKITVYNYINAYNYYAYEIMFIIENILKFIYKNSRLNKETWIFIDEVLPINHPSLYSYLHEIQKRLRPLGACLCISTSDTETFLNTEYAKEIMSLSRYSVFFQESTYAQSIIADLFDFTNKQRKAMENIKGVGNGMLLYPYEHKYRRGYYVFSKDEV